MKFNEWLIVFLILSLNGCIFPTKHTYFLPSASDGKLSGSPCGYLIHKEDNIEREIEGINVSVQTYYTSGKDLTVLINIAPQDNVLEVKAEKIILTDTTLNQKHFPIDVEIDVTRDLEAVQSIWAPAEVLRHWITLKYDLHPENLIKFKILFPTSSILVNGKEINLSPITFEKVEKFDLFFATINC